MADLFLRETAFVASFHRQAASLQRRGNGGDALAAHLERADRRLANLRGWLAEGHAEPPRVLESLFHAAGAASGAVTALGGGRRTMRAASDGVVAIARRYSRHLCRALAPETLYRLSGNYRDVLLCDRWLEERLNAGSPRRSEVVTLRRGGPRESSPGSAGAGSATPESSDRARSRG